MKIKFNALKDSMKAGHYFFFFKVQMSQAPVAHVCNSSNMGG